MQEEHEKVLVGSKEREESVVRLYREDVGVFESKERFVVGDVGDVAEDGVG